MKLRPPKNISEIVPYPPGKPLDELEREYGITGSIKLASNENPWGPSPKAVKAISETLARTQAVRVFIRILITAMASQKPPLKGNFALVRAICQTGSVQMTNHHEQYRYFIDATATQNNQELPQGSGTPQHCDASLGPRHTQAEAEYILGGLLPIWLLSARHALV